MGGGQRPLAAMTHGAQGGRDDPCRAVVRVAGGRRARTGPPPQEGGPLSSARSPVGGRRSPRASLVKEAGEGRGKVGGRCERGAGGGAGSVWGGRARVGRGGELSRRASPGGSPGRRSGRGWPKSDGEPGALTAMEGRGQRWGPHPARRGRIPPSVIHGGESWWRRGERLAVPSRPNRTGAGPAGGIPGGGGRGWAPGLRGPGPGSARAGAGETGRALGLRLGGGEGREGCAGPGSNPERPPGAGRGLPRAAAPWGGGGGVAPCLGDDGAPLERGGGGGVCRLVVGHVDSWPRGMGLYPQPSAPESIFLGEGGGLRGGGGVAVVVYSLPWGGSPVGAPSGVAKKTRRRPRALGPLLGRTSDLPGGTPLYGMVWYGMVWYGMVWYGMVWYGMLLYVAVVVVVALSTALAGKTANHTLPRHCRSVQSAGATLAGWQPTTTMGGDWGSWGKAVLSGGGWVSARRGHRPPTHGPAGPDSPTL